MSRVTEALVPAGTVRMVTVTREAVVYALTNAEADLPGELGRPVWAAFAALGCPMTDRLMTAEAAIESALSADGKRGPAYVVLHYFPADDSLFMIEPSAALAKALH